MPGAWMFLIIESWVESNYLLEFTEYKIFRGNIQALIKWSHGFLSLMQVPTEACGKLVVILNVKAN